MAKGFVLRVAPGIDLSPDMTRTLGTLLPDYRVEHFTVQPNHQESYRRRIQSLREAFLFILDAYPLDPQVTSITKETLMSYERECFAACDFRKTTMEDLQKELTTYTAKLIEMLAVCWRWSTPKEVIECLNKAEQYILMKNGRENVATLTRILLKDGTYQYYLQMDRSLPPYYDRLLAELEVIRAERFPKTPAWFSSLNEEQQAYFCSLDLKILSDNGFFIEFESFLKKWLEVKSLALVPMDKFSPHLREMVKILTASTTFKPELFFTTEFLTSLKQVLVIPQWYWSLPHIEQCFLEHSLKNVRHIREAIPALSSRHRSIPAPANYGVHELFKLNEKGELKPLGGRRFRSSHIASREMLDSSSAVQKRHAHSIWGKVTEEADEEQAILMQTLISPMHGAEKAPNFVAQKLPPDLPLFHLARSTVSASHAGPNTFQLNHPFNPARWFYPTASNDTDCLALLAFVKERMKIISEVDELYKKLDDLYKDYEGVLNSAVGTATFWDYNGRELFLSSLEQLIILTLGGYSYGSCVSGKDRKGIELIHTDAMMMYKDQYGHWPKFNELPSSDARKAFIGIVADLYISRHQHILAGQNAPGAEGIKTPAWYWPNDIAEAIKLRLGNAKALIEDDILASNNEVKAIGNFEAHLSPVRKNELLGQLTAKQLGMEVCTHLYDALNNLVNEAHLFHAPPIRLLSLFSTPLPSLAPNLPAGISGIEAVLKNPQAGDNLARMAKIFTTILNRPEEGRSRTATTNAVYAGIRRLCGSQGREPKVIDEVQTNWTRLFEQRDEIKSNLSVATPS